MNLENMLEIMKPYEDKKIRTVWVKDEEKYYISVVDIVSVLTESSDGRKYWNKLKQRLREEEKTGKKIVTSMNRKNIKELE